MKVIADTNGNILASSGSALILPEATAVTHPDPTISLNSSTGVVTASHTQSSGEVVGGTTTATLQLTTQAAQTITPGTTNQTIASGKYLTGAQTISGSANLVASNIKSGVSIFGVTGSYEGSGGGGSGGATLEFYPLSTSNGSKGPRPPIEPTLNYYCVYPSINGQVPVAILFVDTTKNYIPFGSAILESGDTVYDYSSGSFALVLTAITATVATFSSSMGSINVSSFVCAPIYAINNN